MIDVDALAKLFCEVLREWLTPSEMYEVIKRNKAREHPLICHSHDFCDANMAMEEAFRRYGISEVTEDLHSVWSAAWSRAVAADFNL